MHLHTVCIVYFESLPTLLNPLAENCFSQVCAPIYLRNKISTLPEYLELRYNSQCRTVLAVTSLVAYVLSKLSVSVFSGAQIAEVVFGINKMVAAVGLILVTAVYTVFGGLTAVIFTDGPGRAGAVKRP
jgi:Na+/proline symporter